MKIISIDPGYERLGIAIIEKVAGGKEIVIHSECFKTLAKDLHHVRLGQIHDHIDKIIAEFKPEALSIEKLFFNTNQKTATKVSEARGVIIGMCASRGLGVYEFTPLQIKVSVTGNGRSDKSQVVKMIPLLVKIDRPIKHDDEYDAIACGLTYFAYNNRG